MSPVIAPPLDLGGGEPTFVVPDEEVETFILDAETGARVLAKIRRADIDDGIQLLESGPSYKVDPQGNYEVYVLTTERDAGERIEGALCITPSRYHGAKSLSVEGVDAAPWNMYDTEGREY
ncbi:MAG: hypothetical protein ABH851_03575 [Methanobacteriota archaeon]